MLIIKAAYKFEGTNIIKKIVLEFCPRCAFASVLYYIAYCLWRIYLNKAIFAFLG